MDRIIHNTMTIHSKVFVRGEKTTYRGEKIRRDDEVELVSNFYYMLLPESQTSLEKCLMYMKSTIYVRLLYDRHGS